MLPLSKWENQDKSHSRGRELLRFSWHLFLRLSDLHHYSLSLRFPVDGRFDELAELTNNRLDVGLFPGLTHHNSESGLAGKPCLLVKSKPLDPIFATFR